MKMALKFQSSIGSDFFEKVAIALCEFISLITLRFRMAFNGFVQGSFIEKQARPWND